MVKRIAEGNQQFDYKTSWIYSQRDEWQTNNTKQVEQNTTSIVKFESQYRETNKTYKSQSEWVLSMTYSSLSMSSCKLQYL